MPGQLPAICLMGPTASGKTALALRLADELPVDIISVDSALVYRGMNIGTAKPAPETLRRYPHRLIDIREPEQTYSAGDFVREATDEMANIRQRGRIPLLVGGTMMYFRALTRGISALPSADRVMRARLDAEAAVSGWPAMHRKLAEIDAMSAAKISINDQQRIQRALEVYFLSGRSLSDWHAQREGAGTGNETAPPFVKIALIPEPRAELHRRVGSRLSAMLAEGFVEEVRQLQARPALDGRSPSMRAVGYRQLWLHLEGACDFDEAVARTLVATRQLAKRQLTWLRSEPDLLTFNPLEPGTFDTIVAAVKQRLAL